MYRPRLDTRFRGYDEGQRSRLSSLRWAPPTIPSDPLQGSSRASRAAAAFLTRVPIDAPTCGAWQLADSAWGHFLWSAPA